MKLSTRSRYGLRAMIELAQSYGGEPVLMSAIADNQAISSKYLHALLTALKSAGLVRSLRGSNGGYALTREPSSIRVGEVVRVLEGSLSVVDCVEDEHLCGRADLCVTRDIWQAMSRAVEGALDRFTLSDLVARKQEKETGSEMYYI